MAEEVLAFCGAFNPPTKAHIDIAEYAMNELGLKKVIFIPSKSSYIINVQKKNHAFNDDLRLLFLKKIASTHPWMEICDYELKQEKQPRTYETLCYLREKGYAPHLLMGADVFCNLEMQWHNVFQIGKEFGYVVVDRVHEDMDTEVEDLLDFDPYYQELIPYLDFLPIQDRDTLCMSSTDARMYIEELESARDELKAVLPEEIQKDLMKMIVTS